MDTATVEFEYQEPEEEQQPGQAQDQEQEAELEQAQDPEQQRAEDEDEVQTDERRQEQQQQGVLPKKTKKKKKNKKPVHADNAVDATAAEFERLYTLPEADFPAATAAAGQHLKVVLPYTATLVTVLVDPSYDVNEFALALHRFATPFAVTMLDDREHTVSGLYWHQEGPTLASFLQKLPVVREAVCEEYDDRSAVWLLCCETEYNRDTAGIVASTVHCPNRAKEAMLDLLRLPHGSKRKKHKKHGT